MRQVTSLLLAIGAISCWPLLAPAISQTHASPAPISQSSVGQENLIAPNEQVSAKLAEYDRTRVARLLLEAGDAATRRFPEAAADPALRLQLARQRIAGWLAILTTLKRDIDPSFNPDDKPFMNVEPPPSPDGGQLPAGISPREIADPKARATYIAEIEKNGERLEKFGLMARLIATHSKIMEKALRSMLDTHQTLGLPLAAIRASAAAADITQADRDTILEEFR